MSTRLAADFALRYPGGPQVRGMLDVAADSGGVTVLFGPSGCGKTTVLRCLAGMARADSGRIALGGETWFDAARGLCLPPQRRGVGMLFQHYALFPHLTVSDNVTFGLPARATADARRAAAEILARLRVGDLAERYPAQLSGGQQQRVALARAILCQPRLLLLDEPLSALDAPVREQLRGELRRMLVERGRPSIVVTHDRIEALALGDTVCVMTDGAVRQTGPVHEVFSRPGDLAIAQVVGIETVVPGRIVERAEGLAVVEVSGVRLTAVAAEHLGRDVFVCIRGEDVLLERDAPAATSVRNRLAVRVTSRVPEGPLVRIGLDCGFALTALVTRPACEELNLQIGDCLTALIKAPAIHLVEHG